MIEQSSERIRFLQFESLAVLPGFIHAFSTRSGGVSAAPFDSLNLGLHVGDDPATVRENRARFGRAAGVDVAAFTVMEQVHGNRVARVAAGDRGRGAARREDSVPGADALVTDVPGVPIVGLSADCAMVVLFAPDVRAIGIAHASWRGTAGNVAGAAVRALAGHYGADPGRILAGIGPAIGPCCYAVKGDVREAIGAAGVTADAFQERSGRIYLDLATANRLQLRSAGLREENIQSSGLCTACRGDWFYSHRRDAGRTGRMALVAMLVP
ncbi:MAG: peptidoglycan editing factor PgeF [Planctomycetota bacterium]